jgi:hypothetical protein
MDCVLRLLGELENRGLLMEEQPQESEDHMMALDNRGKVVKEILDTERTYVASLEIMQVRLLGRLVRCGFDVPSRTTSGSCPRAASSRTIRSSRSSST